MKQMPKATACPVEVTLSIVGGKWKPMIVWHLLSGTKRFGELRRLIPGATQQMLTMQLRELEQARVLHREVYAQVPPKVEYSLTELGRSLESILLQMAEWGEWYCDQNGQEHWHIPSKIEELAPAKK
ncbi:winged helix-turn-helix transcriptional regulator [Ktedonobacter robiniae]|uniref:HTH-type transcriptional regulator YdeP n=1 Tax=Ktedonobacter robiniae TaxID=2778365 RepID=A0ABQ3US39_9CHLR|nr:helix-turn-helix domain-containing protein [Ktedonobacter robiniae]GHO55182.1 putative HTH-type transcriptional regulator YdeP [Ktedonobacter robiniae]